MSTPTGVALRRGSTATRAFASRDGARGLPLLLPAALSARRSPGRARAAAERRCTAASRSSARCSARRTAGSAPTTSSPAGPWRRAGEDQRAFGWDAPAVAGSARRGARGVPRARRHHRPDARSARSRSTGRARWRCSSACATTASTGRSGASSTRSSSTRAAASSPTSRSRAWARTASASSPARAAIDSDLGWLRAARCRGDGSVTLRDVTDELAVIGIWGPRARDVLAAVDATTTSRTRRCPYRARARSRSAAPTVLAQRITYVGELGYELYVAPEWAVQVWDRLMAAGARARHPRRRLPRARVAADREGLPLLRHRPHARRTRRTRAASASASRAARATSSARGARAAPGRGTALRTLLVGDARLPARSTAARRCGATARSPAACAAAPTASRSGRNIALGTVPPDLDGGRARRVEVLGEPVAAEVAADVLYDPQDLRLRG